VLPSVPLPWPDVDLLPGDDQAAPAADAALDACRVGCGLRWWASGAGVADTANLRRAEDA
jgi:hypothetical protein